MTETLDFQPDFTKADGDGQPAFEDYFGFNERRQWFFPDGKQFIEYKLMDEGARAEYQKATSKDVRLFKSSGDASIKVDPSEERRILLTSSVVGWLMYRRDDKGTVREVPFPNDPKQNNGEFMKWLRGANPKLVSDLEAEIRKANPWMNADVTVKQIDEEIEELQKLRAEVVAREEGKAAS